MNSPQSPFQDARGYEFSDCRLDKFENDEWQLLKRGQPTKLQDRQLRLLFCFIRRPQEHLTNKELIDEVWETDYDPEKDYHHAGLGNLQQQISRLRRAIGHVWRKNELIEQFADGYRLTVPVKRIVSVPIPPKPISSLSFGKWARTFEDRFLKLWLGGGVLVSLVLLSIAIVLKFTYDEPLPNWAYPRFFLGVVQTLIIVVILAVSQKFYVPELNSFSRDPELDLQARRACGFDDEEKWTTAKKSAMDSLRRFTRYWQVLLAVWFVLYIVLSLLGYFTAEGQDPPELLRYALNILNNCNSLALALCFVVLDHPTFAVDPEQRTSLQTALRKVTVVGVITIILFSATVWLLRWIPFSPRADFAVNVFETADVVSGLIGGVVLALLVGRTQSKFLSRSIGLPLALYLYVVIQSLFVMINLKFVGGGAIIVIALALKSLLCLYVAWLYKSGRFLFYLLRVKNAYLRTNPDWTDFLRTLQRKDADGEA